TSGSPRRTARPWPARSRGCRRRRRCSIKSWWTIPPGSTPSGMAKISGGIGTSHVPTIGIAFDKGKQNDPDWRPLFKGYEPVAKWLAERKPDVLFFCFNDHATTFFFDHYPTFALGVSEEYRIADEGLGPRSIPSLKGHAPLARHIARSLVNDEFDLAIFQDLPLDHGLHSPLTMMWPTKPDWPAKVVPLVVNVL